MRKVNCIHMASNRKSLCLLTEKFFLKNGMEKNGNNASVPAPLGFCVCLCVCVFFQVNCLRRRWNGPNSWRHSSGTTMLSCKSGGRLSSHPWCCWTRYRKKFFFLLQIVKNNNSENVVLLLFMCFNIFNSFIFNISVILILFLWRDCTCSHKYIQLSPTSLIFIYAISEHVCENFEKLMKWLVGVYLY